MEKERLTPIVDELVQNALKVEIERLTPVVDKLGKLNQLYYIIYISSFPFICIKCTSRAFGHANQKRGSKQVF
mgnify:CR=1 FL=1